MEIDQLMEACDAVEWLKNQAMGSASGDSDESRAAVTMGLSLQLARMYLLEYCVHVRRGADTAAAVAKTARGELELKPEQLAEIRRQFHWQVRHASCWTALFCCTGPAMCGPFRF